jgi:dCTP deaminase
VQELNTTSCDRAALHRKISKSYNLLRSFKERLETLSVEDFPSDSAPELLSTLTALAQALLATMRWRYNATANELESSGRGAPDSKRSQGLEMRVSAVARITASLTPMIKYLDGARVSENPWGLVGQVERLCEAMAPGSKVVIRPRWEYNYTYSAISADLRKISIWAAIFDADLHGALDSVIDGSPNFFSLTFPSTELSNVLLMAIWGHELGHLVDNLEGEKASAEMGRYLSEQLASRLPMKISPAELKTLLAGDADTLPGSQAASDLDEVGDRITQPIVQIVRGWARELFADVFSVRLFGPASILAFADFALPVSVGIDTISGVRHPSLRIRLKVMLEELDLLAQEYGRSWHADLRGAESASLRARLDYLRSLITTRADYVIEGTEAESKDTQAKLLFLAIMDRKVEELVALIREQIDQVTRRTPHKCFLTPNDLTDLWENVEALTHRVPPSTPELSEQQALAMGECALGRILNAGWIHWIGDHGIGAHMTEDLYDEAWKLAATDNGLIMKAIESTEAQRWFLHRHKYGLEASGARPAAHGDTVPAPIVQAPATAFASGILTRSQISQRLASPSWETRLVVSPLLDRRSQLGQTGIDLRLAGEFIVIKRPVLTAVDPADARLSGEILRYQTKVYIPFGRPYVLHPQQMVLGGTLEYIAMPADLLGLVVGRSSLGRLGLFIVTAPKVDPLYCGCLTLELINMGSVPIHLYPGTRIGQLILYPTAQ